MGRRGDVEWNKRLSLSGESKTSNRAQMPSLVVYLTRSTCFAHAKRGCGGRFRFKVENEEVKDTWSEVPAAV